MRLTTEQVRETLEYGPQRPECYDGHDAARLASDLLEARGEIERLHLVAEGASLDYGGGYHGHDLEVYQHGMRTVVRAMRAEPGTQEAALVMVARHERHLGREVDRLREALEVEREAGRLEERRLVVEWAREAGLPVEYIHGLEAP